MKNQQKEAKSFEKIADGKELSARRFVRAKCAWKMLGIGRSTFYGLQQSGAAQYDRTFPPSYLLRDKVRVWDQQELIAWVKSRKVSNEVEVCHA